MKDEHSQRRKAAQTVDLTIEVFGIGAGFNDHSERGRVH
jgi:hypothetical protein